MQELRIVQRHRRVGLPRTMKVELVETSEPCGIMLEPIDDVQVPGVPLLFNVSKPMQRGMKLECGHMFATGCIMYHWARSHNVKCPLCRQGPPGWLNLYRLPPHFRTPLIRKVNKAKKSDRLDRIAQIRSDRDYALQLQNAEQPYCDILFEAYDNRVLRLRVHSHNNIYTVRNFEPIHEFLRPAYRYRLSVITGGIIYPVTPWARFDMSWVWAGPVVYSVHVEDGLIDSIVVVT